MNRNYAIRFAYYFCSPLGWLLVVFCITGGYISLFFSGPPIRTRKKNPETNERTKAPPFPYFPKTPKAQRTLLVGKIWWLISFLILVSFSRHNIFSQQPFGALFRSSNSQKLLREYVNGFQLPRLKRQQISVCGRLLSLGSWDIMSGFATVISVHSQSKACHNFPNAARTELAIHGSGKQLREIMYAF